MSDATTIWRFGRWLANEGSGTVRLTWSSGRAVLHLVRGELVALEGLDPACVAAAVGHEPTGEADLFAEAAILAERTGVPPNRTLAAVKRCLERALEAWILDPGRGFEVSPSLEKSGDGSSISLSHVMVELLLSGEDPVLAEKVLPDERVLLRRGPGFLERYARLQLSEEADLVVAKITGTRTARELLDPSPHPRDEVLRLLAALTASGLLEPVPVAEPEPSQATFQPILETQPTPPPEPLVRRLPWSLLAAAAVVLVLVLVALTFALRQRPATGAEVSGSWGVVVDMGCEAVDYERMLRKVRKHPDELRAVKTDAEGKEPCWRLIWGEYPNRERALEALSSIPADALAEGFSPHVVSLGDPAERRDAP